MWHFGWQRSRLKGKQEGIYILPDCEQETLIQARKYPKLPLKVRQGLPPRTAALGPCLSTSVVVVEGVEVVVVVEVVLLLVPVLVLVTDFP